MKMSVTNPKKSTSFFGTYSSYFLHDIPHLSRKRRRRRRETPKMKSTPFFWEKLKTFHNNEGKLSSSPLPNPERFRSFTVSQSCIFT